jgi:phosphoribosyl 1,2-cyclic phosphodiesterase
MKPSRPGASAAKPSRLLVRFWGVRGSIPTPGPTTIRYGGNTSCVEVRCGGEIVILDAGTGIRSLGAKLVGESFDQPLSLTLLLTHTHWDHIQGFPFFQPAYLAKNRIRVIGCKGARRGLASVLNSQMESPFFPVGLKDLPSSLSIEELTSQPFALGPIQVSFIRVNHPGRCVGYRLTTPFGTVAYFPDNELAARLPASFPVRLEDREFEQFIRLCDVVIIDTQYDRNEYPAHAGWGHGCLDDVIRVCARAKVKRCYLFHHDPTHTDARIDAMLRHARGITRSHGSRMLVHAAREGDEIVLKDAAKPKA